MSAAVNSMIGVQSDSIGRGANGSESGEESGSLESRVPQSTGLVLGSIAVGVTAPEVASNRPSSIGAVGFELRIGADAGAASRALFGGRARSCPSRQCGTLGCGSNPSKIKSSRMTRCFYQGLGPLDGGKTLLLLD